MLEINRFCTPTEQLSFARQFYSRRGHQGTCCCKPKYTHRNGNKCSPIYSICLHPREAIFIDPEHQLQTASNTLYVLGTLGGKNTTSFLTRRVRCWSAVFHTSLQLANFNSHYLVIEFARGHRSGVIGVVYFLHVPHSKYRAYHNEMDVYTKTYPQKNEYPKSSSKFSFAF